jgi:MiaB-like tRNA modifying enzyme
MKYYVESYGCTMNFGEGRVLSEYMASMGYFEVCSAEEADIVILNTCTVVETTEKHMLSRISEMKKQGKEIIVTGCMAKAQPHRIEIRLPDSPIIPPEDYHLFTDRIVERYGIVGDPRPVKGTVDAILPIAQGCLGNCSYCITKFARGDLHSYSHKELVERFRRFVKQGSKEILITAQDTASYGRDTDTDLPTLLKDMLSIDGDFRVRLGMMNPNALERISDALMDIMESDERLYRFVHIPVQSASDSVLRNMRRQYRYEDFKNLVLYLRSRIPEISIATDVICGFPGETDEDHASTIRMIRDLRMDTVNITRFSARPGTDAASMIPVHGRISKDRSAELTNVKNETEGEVNRNLVGKKFVVLATEKGKDGTVTRTGNYRPIVVKDVIELGTFLEVEVVDSRPTYLLGKIV